MFVDRTDENLLLTVDRRLSQLIECHSKGRMTVRRRPGGERLTINIPTWAWDGYFQQCSNYALAPNRQHKLQRNLAGNLLSTTESDRSAVVTVPKEHVMERICKTFAIDVPSVLSFSNVNESALEGYLRSDPAVCLSQICFSWRVLNNQDRLHLRTQSRTFNAQSIPRHLLTLTTHLHCLWLHPTPNIQIMFIVVFLHTKFSHTKTARFQLFTRL